MDKFILAENSDGNISRLLEPFWWFLLSSNLSMTRFIRLINNPNLTKSLLLLPRQLSVADLSVFNKYLTGIVFQVIRETIPVPLRRVRTTRSSTHSHPFQVSLPNPRTLSHKSSFIPRTSNLWNVLPSSCFPETNNLPSFKSKINKLHLISLSS